MRLFGHTIDYNTLEAGNESLNASVEVNVFYELPAQNRGYLEVKNCTSSWGQFRSFTAQPDLQRKK